MTDSGPVHISPWTQAAPRAPPPCPGHPPGHCLLWVPALASPTLHQAASCLSLGKVQPVPTFCIKDLMLINLDLSLTNDKQFLQQQQARKKA